MIQELLMLQHYQVFLYNTYFSTIDFNVILKFDFLRFFEDNSFLQFMKVASDTDDTHLSSSSQTFVLETIKGGSIVGRRGLMDK